MNNYEPLLEDSGKGFSLSFKGHYLYSSRDPQKIPNSISSQVDVQNQTLFLIPSPCLCYGLTILAEKIGNDCAILCTEEDEQLFEIAKQTIDQNDLLKSKCILVKPEDDVKAFIELEKRTITKFRRIKELCLSAGSSLYKEKYEQSKNRLIEYISRRARNLLSMIKMGRLWTKNTITNLIDMDWNRVVPLSFPNKPIFVCGAGSSLDKSIEVIKKYRDKLCVISCDTASGALSNQGITPDIVVCLEAQIYNVADFISLKDRKVKLIADISCHPSTFKVFQGEISLVSSQWTFSNFLSSLYKTQLPILQVPPLGSVGVLCLHIANYFDVPFYFSGLDFSYPKGQTHCRYSPNDIKEKIISNRLYNSSSWDSSFSKHTQKLNSGWITDPALSMYGQLAMEELYGKRAFDMRDSKAYPLNTESIDMDNFELSLEIISKWIREKNEILNKNNTMHLAQKYFSDYKEEAKAFLQSLKSGSEKLRKALSFGCDKEELISLLKENDFLYMHFPDPERVLLLEDDALKRVVEEIAYWKSRLYYC